VNPKTEALRARTKRFAIDVLVFAKTLSFDEPDRSISRQLARAATSVGANYRAACRARSRAEFAAKVGIVLEEADESLFWLEVIDEASLECARPVWKRLIQEAGELTAIFAASSITARQPPSAVSIVNNPKSAI
jgi:four helix bundle protein